MSSNRFSIFSIQFARVQVRCLAARQSPRFRLRPNPNERRCRKIFDASPITSLSLVSRNVHRIGSRRTGVQRAFVIALAASA